jgi:hypothetical protein
MSQLLDDNRLAVFPRQGYLIATSAGVGTTGSRPALIFRAG